MTTLMEVPLFPDDQEQCSADRRSEELEIPSGSSPRKEAGSSFTTHLVRIGNKHDRRTMIIGIRKSQIDCSRDAEPVIEPLHPIDSVEKMYKPSIQQLKQRRRAQKSSKYLADRHIHRPQTLVQLVFDMSVRYNEVGRDDTTELKVFAIGNRLYQAMQDQVGKEKMAKLDDDNDGNVDILALERCK
ncbi:hypothetical protein MMC25_006045 [Agyrium rufum]|nr:hypothetical protein [Agyrium rufum]